jgi:hypothetical protein
VRILPYVLCKISSLHLSYLVHVSSKGRSGLAWKIWWRQVLSVYIVHPATKWMLNRVKRPWFGLKFFRDVPWVVWLLFYLNHVVLAPAKV